MPANHGLGAERLGAPSARPAHRRESQTQNARSRRPNRSRLERWRSRASCCRSARFSSARLVRVLSAARAAPKRASTRDIALQRRSMPTARPVPRSSFGKRQPARETGWRRASQRALWLFSLGTGGLIFAFLAAASTGTVPIFAAVTFAVPTTLLLLGFAWAIWALAEMGEALEMRSVRQPVTLCSASLRAGRLLSSQPTPQCGHETRRGSCRSRSERGGYSRKVRCYTATRRAR